MPFARSLTSARSRRQAVHEPGGMDGGIEVMHVPRDAVENQILCFIRDRYTGTRPNRQFAKSKENEPHRAHAVAVSFRGTAVGLPLVREWRVQESGLWSDEWGQARSDDGRIGTRPNWARQSTISGLAFGDEAHA